MANVGWWASNTPLYLADGYRYRSNWRRQQPVRLSTDHRLRHVYAVGSTGSGKSRCVRRLILQDVVTNRGFTLIDPHGDLSREVLASIAELALGPGKATCVETGKLGDKLVVLQPDDQRFGAPSLNLLEIGPGQVAYQIVDAIIGVIREIWPETFGPRLEDVCRHSLLLLSELGLTALEMLPLLSCDAFRAALVARSRNPDLRLYFTEHLGGLRPAEIKT